MSDRHTIFFRTLNSPPLYGGIYIETRDFVKNQLDLEKHLFECVKDDFQDEPVLQVIQSAVVQAMRGTGIALVKGLPREWLTESEFQRMILSIMNQLADEIQALMLELAPSLRKTEALQDQEAARKLRLKTLCCLAGNQLVSATSDLGKKWYKC